MRVLRQVNMAVLSLIFSGVCEIRLLPCFFP